MVKLHNVEVLFGLKSKFWGKILLQQHQICFKKKDFDKL